MAFTETFSNYSITDNDITASVSGVQFLYQNSFMAGSKQSNIIVSGNRFTTCPSGAVHFGNSPVGTYENVRITNNVYDTSVSSAHNFGFVNLGTGVEAAMTDLVIDELEGDGMTARHTLKIISGEWDEPHLVIGDGANAFHVWQDNTNLRGKKGAPTSAGDGAVIV